MPHHCALTSPDLHPSPIHVPDLQALPRCPSHCGANPSHLIQPSVTSGVWGSRRNTALQDLMTANDKLVILKPTSLPLLPPEPSVSTTHTADQATAGDGFACPSQAAQPQAVASKSLTGLACSYPDGNVSAVGFLLPLQPRAMPSSEALQISVGSGRATPLYRQECEVTEIPGPAHRHMSNEKGAKWEKGMLEGGSRRNPWRRTRH